ncbi:MAG: SURF1 family protein [Lysobacteraceae bacterium]|nr:SURF1 family protein [Xanthomonadales bacterium]HPF73292.1 SURF1 family protein [Xanthomonadaceae bacterium]
MARRGNLVFLTALAVLLVASFMRLGFWQLERARWKAEWLAQWQAAEQAPAHLIEAKDLVDERGDEAPVLRHVSVRGEWSERPLVLLDNRIRDGRVGYEVYRVLRSADLPVSLLVDLGWQAWDDRRDLPTVESLLAASEIDADSELSGMLSPWPGQGLAVGDAGSMDAEGRLLLSRLDHDVIGDAWLTDSRQGLLAVAVLKLDPELPVGFARDREVLPNTLPPERHRGYAVQWFALALAVALIYGVLLWKSKRNRDRQRKMLA